MDGPSRPAEDYADYRFFRLLTVGGARLVVACLFLIGWNLLVDPSRRILLFLGNTALLGLAVSLVFGTLAYTMFKRRGGRVERSKPPAHLGS